MAKRTRSVVAADEQPKPLATADAAPPKLSIVRPIEEVPVFYSNQAMIRTTKLDVQIMHNQTIKQEEGELTVSPQVIVYLSHAHARKIAKIILDQLANLEANQGVKIVDV